MGETNTSGGADIEGNLDIGGDFVGRDQFVNINGVVINITGLDRASLEVLSTIVQKMKDRDLPNRKSVFEFHIEPIFQRLKIVHKDYEESLFKFRALLEPRLKISSATSHQWLEMRSLLYKADRKLLKNVEEELNTVRTALRSDIKFVDAIFDFSQAILGYLYCQSEISPVASATRKGLYIFRKGTGIGYTRLLASINEPIDVTGFQEDLDSLPTNIKETNESLRKERILKALDTLSVGLPEKWEGVCKSYLKVKGLSLL